MDEALARVPRGRWTTYGDLARVAGTSARIVGALMATGDFELAHRVLTASGRPSSGFGPEQRTILETEGVPFDDLGRADPTFRAALPSSADEIADD